VSGFIAEKRTGAFTLSADNHRIVKLFVTWANFEN